MSSNVKIAIANFPAEGNDHKSVGWLKSDNVEGELGGAKIMTLEVTLKFPESLTTRLVIVTQERFCWQSWKT